MGNVWVDQNNVKPLPASLGPEGDDGYFITVTPVASAGSPVPGAHQVVLVAKSKEDFTVTVESPPAQGHSVTFGWHLIR